MALITENGTGLANAESYISVIDATAYHAARGNAAWAALADDATREQMLRRATDFIEQLYRDRWAGYRVSLTQALSWPRYEAPVKDAHSPTFGNLRAYYPSDAVPTLVAKVCALLALRAISGELSAIPDVAVKRKRVGPIDIEYFEPVMPVRSVADIEEMLRPLLAGSDMNIRVVRA